MLTITLIASLAVLTLPFLRPDGGRTGPLQIVVAEPELRGSGVDLRRQQLLLEAVRDSLERQLSGRRGLVPVRLFVPAAQALEVARGLGADEVLSTRIRNGPYGAQVGLGRRRTIDASMVWQRDEVQVASDDLRRIDRQLGEQLQLAYIRYDRPPEAAQLFAEAADYEAYLKLRLEAQSGADPLDLLPSFASLRGGSPRFFEAYLWPARLAAGRISSAPAAADRAEDALMLLQQASRIAPADPRPFETAFRLLLDRGRRGEAAERLEQLERVSPNDPRLISWRSLLDQKSVPEPVAGAGGGLPEQFVPGYQSIPEDHP